MEQHSGRQEFLKMLRDTPLPTASKCEHLLRVAGSVNQDAQQVWAQLWAELKPHVTASGTILPSLEKGFVPAGGWPEFLERMWLLKHYLDSVNRICHDSNTQESSI